MSYLSRSIFALFTVFFSFNGHTCTFFFVLYRKFLHLALGLL